MKSQHVALAIIIAILWGLNYTAAKEAVAYFPTFLLLGLRLMIVSVLLLPFMKKLTVPFVDMLCIAVIFSVMHLGLMFLSLQGGLDASVAVVVDQFRIVFAMLLGYLFFKEEVSIRSVMGVCVAILGVVVISDIPTIDINKINQLALLVASGFFWAIYNIQMKKIKNMDAISFIGWSSLIGAPIMILISFIVESNHIDVITSAPAAAVVSLVYVAIFATIVAHGCWYYLLSLYRVNQVTPYSLLIPIFGISSSIILLDEFLTWQIVIGGVITILGVAVIITRKKDAKI